MVLLTAYNNSQKVDKQNALSGNTTLGARGPACGGEHYTSTLRLALLYLHSPLGLTPVGTRGLRHRVLGTLCASNLPASLPLPGVRIDREHGNHFRRNLHTIYIVCCEKKMSFLMLISELASHVLLLASRMGIMRSDENGYVERFLSFLLYEQT